MLKKLILISLLFTTFLFAKTNIVVTVVPQKSFVEKIGGEFVEVTTMIPIGADPHNYEPKPSQMVAISKADIYMKIGLNEFETHWLPKFISQNRDMKVENVTKSVNHIKLKENEEYHEHEYHHHNENEDPHIWMSPKEVKIIAKNIFEILITFDSKNKNSYKVNYEKFIKEVDEVDNRIKEILKDVPKNAKIMVFHPAFGYFARDYNLKQHSIEFEGKEPKPKMLIKLIKEAKEVGIKVIITEPEFSDKTAKVIAKEIGAKVESISPLSLNWAENLIELAKAVAKSYNIKY